MSRLLALPFLLVFALSGCVTFYRPPGRPGGDIQSPGTRTASAGEQAALLRACGYTPMLLEAEDSSLTGPFLLLPVRANGKSARAAVDTGASVLHIPPDFADKIGMKLRATKARALSVAGETKVQAGVITQLEASAFSWKNVPAAADREQRNGILLGISELSGLGALVDYANRVLWIAPEAAQNSRTRSQLSGLTRRLSTTLRAAGFVEVPLVAWDEHWMARVTINGRTENLLVDTGAQLTVFFGRTAKTHYLTPIESPFRVAGANAANRQAKAVSIRELGLGQVTVRNLLAVVLPMEELIRALEAAGDRSPGGILGSDVLEKSSALLDCSSGKLFIPGAQQSGVK